MYIRSLRKFLPFGGTGPEAQNPKNLPIQEFAPPVSSSERLMDMFDSIYLHGIHITIMFDEEVYRRSGLLCVNPAHVLIYQITYAAPATRTTKKPLVSNHVLSFRIETRGQYISQGFILPRDNSHFLFHDTSKGFILGKYGQIPKK